MKDRVLADAVVVISCLIVAIPLLLIGAYLLLLWINHSFLSVRRELFPNAVDGRDNLSGDSFSVDEHDAVDQVF
jgi:hypothetical protein